MKPFDLEAAKEGKPVITRDGRPVRIICTDMKQTHNMCPVIALIQTNADEESLETYSQTGKARLSGDDDRDLFMAPEKKTGWINLYRYDKIVQGYVYESEGLAKVDVNRNKGNYVATVKIEWEE